MPIAGQQPTLVDMMLAHSDPNEQGLSMGLETHQILAAALQIQLTLPVSLVASCQCSFSKMRLRKSYLRFKVLQERLTNLTVLLTENDVATSNNFGEVLRDFAAIKETFLYRW